MVRVTASRQDKNQDSIKDATSISQQNLGTAITKVMSDDDNIKNNNMKHNVHRDNTEIKSQITCGHLCHYCQL